MMTTPLECPVCFCVYTLDTAHGRRPMSLPCGHTLCSDCISRLIQKSCPTCRASFTSSAPNFTLQHVITANSAPETQEVMNVQIKALSKRLAIGQSRVRECDAKVKLTLEKSAETQWEVAEARRILRAAQEKNSAASAAEAGARYKAESAKSHLRELNQALLPLRRPLEDAGLDAGSSLQASTSNKNKKLRYEMPKQQHQQQQQQQPRAALQLPGRRVDPVQYFPLLQPLVRPVVFAQSDSLGDLIQHMRGNHGPPAEYDLQGLVMKYSGFSLPCITSCGITLRNGTIQLTDEQSLVVISRDVMLHKVSVVGGKVGVVVAAGSSLNMTRCEIRDGLMGLSVVGNGALVASNLKVRCSGHTALCLENCGAADITDVDFGGANLETAICMSDTSIMMGLRLRFSDAMNHALYLKDKSSVSLEGCSLKSAPQRMIAVKNQATLLVKGSLDFDSIIDFNFLFKDPSAKVMLQNRLGIHYID